MWTLRIGAWMLSIFLSCLGAGAALAQGDYPDKVVRIVTAQPGGGNDFVARLVAQGLSNSLGQPVIVDNRGSIAIETAAKGSPDGYTLLLYTSVVWLAQFFRKNVPWDPIGDFSPITLAVTSPNILVVHPSLPVRSVTELISLAKARPGELNYGSSSAGAAPHLAAELFKSMTGVNMVRIAYKGGGAPVAAVITGEVQVFFPTAASITPHVKAGRLRALAVTSAKPSALVPGLPTVAATLPGYESVSIYGVFARAKTPAAIINFLNREIVQVLHRTDVKERLFNVGAEVAGSSPIEFAATIRTEIARWGKVIKDAGIRQE